MAGGAISGGVGPAVNGGSTGQIIGGAVVGGVFGLGGGAAGEAGEFPVSGTFVANAEIRGVMQGRLWDLW